MKTILTILSFALLTACASTGTHPASTTYGKKHRARVTFYHRFEDSFGAKTAMGIRAMEGVTIAGPKQLRLGLPVLIPRLKGIVGNGSYIIQDRGSAIKGEHFDVYVECKSRSEARKRIRQLEQLEPFEDVYF